MFRQSNSRTGRIRSGEIGLLVQDGPDPVKIFACRQPVDLDFRLQGGGVRTVAQVVQRQVQVLGVQGVGE